MIPGILLIIAGIFSLKSKDEFTHLVGIICIFFGILAITIAITETYNP